MGAVAHLYGTCLFDGPKTAKIFGNQVASCFATRETRLLGIGNKKQASEEIAVKVLNHVFREWRRKEEKRHDLKNGCHQEEHKSGQGGSCCASKNTRTQRRKAREMVRRFERRNWKLPRQGAIKRKEFEVRDDMEGEHTMLGRVQ